MGAGYGHDGVVQDHEPTVIVLRLIGRKVDPDPVCSRPNNQPHRDREYPVLPNVMGDVEAPLRVLRRQRAAFSR
jgi:hypothetical protein